MSRGAPGADFDEFVRSRSIRLIRAAYAMTGDRNVAEDLIQDVMAKVFLRWTSIHTSPDAYAHKVLVRTVTDRWKARYRRPEVPLNPAHDRPTADSADAQALRDELVRALRELPPRQRAVIAMRFLADLSEADVAAAAGCSVGTVKSQISRGLVRLRGVLASGQDDATDRGTREARS